MKRENFFSDDFLEKVAVIVIAITGFVPFLCYFIKEFDITVFCGIKFYRRDLWINIFYFLYGSFLVYFIPVKTINLFKNKIKFTNIFCFLKKYSIVIALLLYMLWITIDSAGFDKRNEIILFGSSFAKDGLLSYYTFLTAFLAGYTVKNISAVKKTFFLLILGADIMSFYLFVCYCFNIPMINMIAGPFGHHNHYAYYLCMMLMMAIVSFIHAQKIKQNCFYLFSVLLLSWQLLINSSFGPHLAVVVSIFYIMIMYLIFDKKLFVKLFITTSVFAIISFWTEHITHALNGRWEGFITDIGRIIQHPEKCNDAGTSRWGIWKTTILIIKENPWFGYGPGGIGKYYALYHLNEGRPHNELLQTATDYGIISTFLYLNFIITLGIQFLSKIKKMESFYIGISGCVLAYFISSQFGIIKFSCIIYYYILLGILSAGIVKFFVKK